MNKKTIIILSIIGIFVFILIAILISFWFNAAIKLVESQSNTEETLLESSVSSDGKYTLEVYKTNPGATVDFSIKAYIITNGNKKLIYNAYHEHEADIVWVSNSQVSINGKTLDLSKNETFDWRNQ